MTANKMEFWRLKQSISKYYCLYSRQGCQFLNHVLVSFFVLWFSWPYWHDTENAIQAKNWCPIFASPLVNIMILNRFCNIEFENHIQSKYTIIITSVFRKMRKRSCISGLETYAWELAKCELKFSFASLKYWHLKKVASSIFEPIPNPILVLERFQ